MVWVPWRRPGFQLGLDIAAVKRGQPAGDRRASSAGTASPPGATTSEECEAQLAGDHPHRAGVPRRARPARAVRRRSSPGYEPLPEAERAGPGRRAGPGAPRPGLAPTGRRSATSPTPTWCWTSWPATEHPAAGRAGHVLPGPLPAHQGPAAGARPAADRAARRGRSRGCASCTPPTARTTPPTTSGTPTPDSPADARRRPGDRAGARASACSASARTSRPPGWPASSTSTRST